MSVGTRATELIGRDREMRALAERIDAAESREGGTLLLRGEAGIGKSSLLDAARAHASSKQFRILATTGIQSESQLPFAGLHQLLRPVLGVMDRLPETYRKAIRSAFGLSDETSPSPFQIALAVLHLLAECAESAPVLLLVDDAQWLDRSTADALAFVARRLESDPIVIIAVMRDGFEGPLLAARLPELRVGGLSDANAKALLDARAPELTPVHRDRILKDAAGNPLALIELSAALAATGAHGVRSTETLPITDRLESAFADRLTSLTSGCRSLLHAAAADESGVLAELLSAASKIEGRTVNLEAAAEAQDAGLVELDGPRLRFRHPLMRSAIYRAMSPRERQAAHAALATTFADDPDRSVWHRAAAAIGSDEQIASDLEAAAVRAERRGAPVVAMEALQRAARLTGAPARGGKRRIRAAILATVIGRPDEVMRLLGEIDDLDLDPLDRPQAAWLRELFVQGSWSGASRVAGFVDVADQMRAAGDVSGGLGVLMNFALRCWWSNPDEETRRALISAAERFPVPEDDARLIDILALAGPFERGAVVVDRLSRCRLKLEGALHDDVLNLGMAAMAVGDFVHAELFQDAYILHCRTQGWLGRLGTTLTCQAWTKVHRGDWKNAGSMASEGARLAQETGQGMWGIVADLAAATIAAYRGVFDVAEELAAAGEQAFLPMGANPMLALVQYPRGVAALAAGRYDEAFQHLRRIFDPSDFAFHPHVRSWVLADLVEAAVHSGHEREAADFVLELEPIAVKTRSPLLEAAMEFARPLVSAGGSEAAFPAGPSARLTSWPFTRARLQLAQGTWLRRHRRAADARTPLRAARDAFDALGAVPWGERARQELRASGETSRRRAYELIDALSPQELQIAQLAAQGLSNKEIGQQLFLSHRTISTHLYRIFPKLGITARSHLRAALQDRSTTHAS